VKKLLFSFFIFIIIVLISILIYHTCKKYIFDIEKPYYAKVLNAKWSTVSLDNGGKVGLAGIVVPDRPEEGPNLFPAMVNNIGKILNGKRVKIELVERARSGAYHKYDLVRIYLEDGTCVNTYILENGMGLFSHGYYRGMEREIEAENRGKKAGKGIWANKDKLDLLYVGSKQWEGIHYPECPEVKKIKLNDRIEYYSRPVAVHWHRDWYPEGCSFCIEIRKTKPKRLQ